LLTSKLNLTVTELILSSRLGLELLLDDSVVSLLLASAHPVEIRGSWLIFANRLLHIERIYLLHEFKVGLGYRGTHAQVEVFFDFFEGHWWGSLGLLDLLSDTMVFLSVYALMLDQIVESLVVSSNPEILLNIFRFLIKLVLIKSVQDLVRLLSLLVECPVDLRHGSLVIVSVSQCRLEVLSLGCRAAQNLTLCAELI